MRVPLRAFIYGSLALFCALRLSAQWQGATIIVSNLIDEGKYEKARKEYQLAFGIARAAGENPYLLAPYSVRLEVEAGALQEAAKVLRRADAETGGDYLVRAPAAKRERAALFLALRDYQRAATAAEQAYRLSGELSFQQRAYCKSLEAEARLRLADLPGAQEAAKVALELVRKEPKPSRRVLVPRVLYTACLVERDGASRDHAEAECQQGLALAGKAGRAERDVALGYLALAESRLRRDDLAGSSEAAGHSLQLTLKLFGPRHQDAVRALQILAQANLQGGYPAAARSWGQRAVKVGLAVFGEGSPGMADLRRELAPCLESPGGQAQ